MIQDTRENRHGLISSELFGMKHFAELFSLLLNIHIWDMPSSCHILVTSLSSIHSFSFFPQIMKNSKYLNISNLL